MVNRHGIYPDCNLKSQKGGNDDSGAAAADWSKFCHDEVNVNGQDLRGAGIGLRSVLGQCAALEYSVGEADWRGGRRRTGVSTPTQRYFRAGESGRLVFRATLGRVNGYAFASHYFVAFDSRAANQLDGPP